MEGALCENVRIEKEWLDKMGARQQRSGEGTKFLRKGDDSGMEALNVEKIDDKFLD